MVFFKLSDLNTFYFSKSQYISNGYTVRYLSNAMFSVNDLYLIGFTVLDLSNSFSTIDFLNSVVPVDGSNGLIQILNTTNTDFTSLYNYYKIHSNNINAIQKMFHIYPIINLYNAGFKISFMKNANIPVSIVYQLEFVPNSNFSISDLKLGGYTLNEIYSLNSMYPYVNITSIYNSIAYTIHDFYLAGFTAYDMKMSDINNYINSSNNTNLVSINPYTLYDNHSSYSLKNIYDACYNAFDFSSNGLTIPVLLTELSIRELENIGYDISLFDYISKYNVSIPSLLQANYTLQDIYPYRFYYSITDFSNSGFNLDQLFNNQFTVYDFYNSYFLDGYPTLHNILNLHFDASNLIQYNFFIYDYYDSSYSSVDLYNNGFSIGTLTTYYSLSNFKNDGLSLYYIYKSNLYTINSFYLAGYQLKDFKYYNIPFKYLITPDPNMSMSIRLFSNTLIEVINVGYNITEIVASHYYPANDFFRLNYSSSIFGAYYSIDELFAGGYSRQELGIEGSKITQYCNKRVTLYATPVKLGSSMNNTRVSAKIAYSKNINNRISTFTSTTITNTPISNTNVSVGSGVIIPQTCTNVLNTKPNRTLCKSTIIPSKTASAFSVFIRNYIITNVKARMPKNSSNEQLLIAEKTAFVEIAKLKYKSPDETIYTVIQNYLHKTYPA
jgi:hypothetical protein